MFKDLSENIKMLKGAYRKLKSYYYYNKNFILMRKKIAEFEYDKISMENTFSIMANVLCHPNANKSIKYFDDLIAKIDFFVIPKKFDTAATNSSKPVSNTIQRDKKMKSVNFFINAPIEIYIFDTLWTVFLSKIDKDKQLLSHNVYGNTINMSSLFPNEDEISFESRVLFNRYFTKYSSWRNNAFSSMEKNYDRKNDSILLSLDIKSYFYSVAFKFDEIKRYFENHEIITQISSLTNFFHKVYSAYKELILPLRKDIETLKQNEYPLPIGLFSSMLIGNIYLKDFDKKIKSLDGLIYYGRYVDDILIVINKSLSQNYTNQDILDSIFVKTDILKKDKNSYYFVGYKSLYVQSNKIKIIYIDHKESRALIDIYNETIKIIPSQSEPLPNSYLDFTNFDETVYSIENFTKENKIRDIGFLGIDSFKVGRFFSALPHRYAHINTLDKDINKEIYKQISQIENFFTGSQRVEFYSNWLNYMYFLVVCGQNVKLHKFISSTKSEINALKPNSLDRNVFKKVSKINRIAKDTLKEHLDICLHLALSIDIDLAKKHFKTKLNSVLKYINCNMFDHSYVSFPLANYLEYDQDVSYTKMKLNQLGKFPEDILTSFKFVWSPRFIHYDELLLLLFFHYHSESKNKSSFKYTSEPLVEKFSKINHMGYIPFEINNNIIFESEDYILEKIDMPTFNIIPPKTVDVAVGSIDITNEKCIQGLERWENLTLKDKKMLFEILEESYSCLKSKKDKVMLLVLPELCFPIYWIKDLIRFSKYSQIAIVTGLQYLGDDTDQKYNYLATLLPFKNGSKEYKNVFVHIREKNDYSPIEFEELAKKGFVCRDRKYANYQVFHWKGVRLTPIVCYELTDIMARAILKGNSDIIAASVFNPDTTYFSNIIDSAVRDLHAFIIQANTSHLGDSRVTGPYDRDNKDIFKIKGGKNDHVVIGTIQFRRLKDFQKNYYYKFNKKIESLRKNKNSKSTNKIKNHPDIKKLSARYKIK